MVIRFGETNLGRRYRDRFCDGCPYHPPAAEVGTPKWTPVNQIHFVELVFLSDWFDAWNSLP